MLWHQIHSEISGPPHYKGSVLAPSKYNVIRQLFRAFVLHAVPQPSWLFQSCSFIIEATKICAGENHRALEGCTPALKCLDPEMTQSPLLTLRWPVLDLGPDYIRVLGNAEETVGIWQVVNVFFIPNPLPLRNSNILE